MKYNRESGFTMDSQGLAFLIKNYWVDEPYLGSKEQITFNILSSLKLLSLKLHRRMIFSGWHC